MQWLPLLFLLKIDSKLRIVHQFCQLKQDFLLNQFFLRNL